MPKLLDEYSLLAIKQFVEGKTEVDANGPSANSNKLITSGAVYAAIEALPEPMLFKGSLGTGGTITSLPTAGAGNEGFTYKVIEAGTYAGQVAKVGDTFICAKTGASSYSWVLIPSGDEPEGTVTNVAVSNDSQGTLDITGGPITTSGTIKVKLADAYGDTKNPYGSKAAHLVLAGPTSGSGYPGFRALTATDLPDISGIFVTRDTDQTISGVKSFSHMGIFIGDDGYGHDLNHLATYIPDGGGAASGFMIDAGSTHGKILLNSASLKPAITMDLGDSTKKWKDLYLSGLLKGNNATYGLQLPDMSSWTANKTIATGGDLANYVTNNGGTSESYEVIGGYKSFTNPCTFPNGITTPTIHGYEEDLVLSASGISFKPSYSSTGASDNSSVNLGTSSNKWGNLYLAGNISDGTNTTSVATLAKLNNIISQQDAFAVLSTGVLSS